MNKIKAEAIFRFNIGIFTKLDETKQMFIF